MSISIKNHNKFILLSFIFIYLLIYCRIKSPVDNVKLILNVKSSPTLVTGSFINALTGDPIGFGTSEYVYVSILGKDKDRVVSMTGEPQTTFTVEDGFISFAIDENITPTKDAPLAITVVASAEGYISNSKTFLIFASGTYPFTMNMVKIDEPPEGVVVKMYNFQTDQNGSVTNDITIKTDPEAITQAIASIMLFEDIVIMDENSVPLVGDLTATLIYFNNISDQSVESFPGGFAVDISQNEYGIQEDAFFITGGFIAIEIVDNNGRRAKIFSDSVKINIQTPGSTINPETGGAIKSGDKIGIWSYNSESGQWKFENEGTAIGPNDQGNYTVAFQSDHLSEWNLDWKTDDCYYGATVNIIGKEIGDCMHIKIKVISSNMVISSRDVCDNVIEFIRVPRNIPVVLEAYDDCGNLRGSVVIPDMCTTSIYTLNVTPPPIQSSTLSIIVTGFCTERPEIEFRPSMPVWYWDQSGCRWIFAGVMKNGKITILGLDVPGSYLFTTVYDGVAMWAIVEIRDDYSVYVPAQDEVYNPEIIDKTLSYEVELPIDFCATLKQ